VGGKGDFPSPFPASGRGKPVKAPRILIVEDDAFCREAMERLLQDSGYETQSCSCGKEALARLTEEGFDILVTDFQMPGMHGLDLISKAREIVPNLVMVLMSGLPQQTISQQLKEMGVDGFLSKPLDWNALSILLGELIRVKGKD
jgi:CheY-like chemotaxis protein